MAAIPAYPEKLSPHELANLTDYSYLCVLESRFRGSGKKLLPFVVRFRNSLCRALVVQTNNFEKGLDTTHSFSNVVQARQLLLNFLEDFPKGLPDAPPSQVETTTKTILP